MALARTLPTVSDATDSDAPALRDYPRINWKFDGDIDETPLDQLIAWASDRDARTTSWEDNEAQSPVATDKKAFNYINKRMLGQYEDMKLRSPVPTLHLVARLIVEMRRYLEITHLRKHKLLEQQEGGYHRWSADAIRKWAGPVEGCLRFSGLHRDRLARKEGDGPEMVPWYMYPLSKRWEDLRSLCDELTTLSNRLVATEEALPPQLTDIEDIVTTGETWASKMVNVDGPMEDRSPNGLIKINDKNGCSFKPADDFRNDGDLRRRIGSPIQVQWQRYHQPDGQYQTAPELHRVKLPEAAWHTVARVAALLEPHRGRQANIASILEEPGYGSWLEKKMEAFFQGRDMDPVEKLNHQMVTGSRSLEPEENGASFKAMERPEQQRIDYH